MTSYTIPESVIGVPLFVPSAHDYFSIEAGGMPNGDDCLKVLGATNRGYKAFQEAPTFSGNDFMHNSSTYNYTWSMSFWIKLTTITADSTGKTTVMLGCSNASAAHGATDLSWQNQTFLVSSRAALTVDTMVYTADVSSQNTSCAIQTIPSNTWTLYVFSNSPAARCQSVINDVVSYTGRSQTNGGASGGNSVVSNPMLHIGAYSASHNGRPGDWYIGKWAFHNHILNATERSLMYHAMVG